MKFYLAARYSRREELAGYRQHLRERGHEVTSRWLDGKHQISNEGIPIGDTGERLVEAPDGDDIHRVMREHFAQEDLEDVIAADALIAFTEQPRSGHSRGGRHVELGIAIASGLQVFVVGPRENLFCYLPEIDVFPDWNTFLTQNADLRPALEIVTGAPFTSSQTADYPEML